MKRFWSVYSGVILCILFLSAWSNCQAELPAAIESAAVVHASMAVAGASSAPPADTSIPAGIQEVMRNSQLKYLEGSNLIKAGESARAREAFNAAVNYLLQSEYDLSSTAPLNDFFRDMIHRIQQDESRYLRPPDGTEESPEGAVVDELNKVDLIPISVDPSLQDDVVADLADARFDIPVILNDKVMKALDYWLSRGKRFFSDGLVRSGRYQEMISRIFREEEIPLDLMYLAQVESLFKTNALSRAQAKGIWQFGKWTAIRYGLKVNSYIDERSDPEKSTRAAARYLNDLYGMFKDWNLVLAAYNWGEGNIQRLIERSGVNDFWELSELRRKVPNETKNHVPLIMASIILAHNPEKYGLPKYLDEPLTYDLVPVSKPIDLREAAKLLQITLEELKQMNPALRGLTTPAGYAEFRLKVPVGSAIEIGPRIAELPTAKIKPPAEYASRYKVRAGDTLSTIARRYRVSTAALMRANPGVAAKSLSVGRWLQVPGVRSAAVKSSTTVKSASTSVVKPASAKVAEVPTAKIKPPAESAGRYKVRAGDTLNSIARRYRVSTAALMRANPGVSARSLRVGIWLQVPAAISAAAKSTTTVKRASTNIVKPASAKIAAKSSSPQKSPPLAVQQPKTPSASSSSKSVQSSGARKSTAETTALRKKAAADTVASR